MDQDNNSLPIPEGQAQQVPKFNRSDLVSSSNPQDVRMKRHPELQPYVPSDRFITFSTSKSSSKGKQQQQQHLYNRNGKTTTSSLASSQAKRYVSMSRLNQLAQPKKAPQAPSSTNNSLNRTKKTPNSSAARHDVTTTLSSAPDLPSPTQTQTSTPAPTRTRTRTPTPSPAPTPQSSTPLSREQIQLASSEAAEPKKAETSALFESAASRLLSESEISTNGIDFDRSPEDLFNEIEQDLGIARATRGSNDGQADKIDDFQDFDKRISSATIVDEKPSIGQIVSVTQKEEQEEDDRRLRIEKELREKARLEEQERKERHQIVENILSRFSQGSVS